MADIPNSFEVMLQRAVLERLKAIVDEECTFAQERIAKRIKEQAPAIACGVYKRFTVTPYQDRLEIVVKLEDKTT